MSFGMARGLSRMRRTRPNDEYRTMGRVDEAGGHASEQQSAASRKPPGTHNDEVLRVSREVVEQRIEDLAVQRHRFHDPGPVSEGTVAQFLEDRRKRTTIFAERHQGLEPGELFPAGGRMHDGDRQSRLESSGNFCRQLHGPTGMGRPIKPDQDSFEHPQLVIPYSRPR